MICLKGAGCICRDKYGIPSLHKTGIAVYDNLGLSFNDMDESNKRRFVMGQHLAKIKCKCLYDTVVLDTDVLYHNGIGIELQHIRQVKRPGFLKFTLFHN